MDDIKRLIDEKDKFKKKTSIIVIARRKLVPYRIRFIAKKIIKIAQEHNVPIIDNPPVARALFRMVDLNQQIPPELYKAVAEILLFVYGLKNKQQ